MAAYQQAGDFSVIKDNGHLKKNGGNVASCFCTPDGRVIHAVGGPVRGKRLHDEAWWATEIWRQIKFERIKTHTSQSNLVYWAHKEYEAVQTTSSKEYRSMLAQSKKSSVWANQTLYEKRPVYNSAHYYFSAGTFSPTSVLSLGPKAFSSLTDQKYVAIDKRVRLAAEGIERAKKEHRPIVLVFYRGTGNHNPVIRFGVGSGKTQKLRPDNVTQTYMNWLTYERDKTKELQNANIVFAPVSEQPALSGLVDLPVYNLNLQSDDSFAVVVANPDGSEVASVAMSGEDFPAQFYKVHRRWHNKANPLVDALAQATETAKVELVELNAKRAIEEATSMRADGKLKGAVRLLKKQLREPLSDSTMVSIKNQLEAWR